MQAAEFLEQVKLKSGDLLFKEGDKSFFFYIIQHGNVEIYLHDENGKKITLAIAEPGQAVGEFAMITKRPRSASAIALTPVELVKISEEGYQQLLKDLPDWAFSMIQTLVDRLSQADETIRKHSLENTKLKRTLEAIIGGAKTN